MGHFQVRYDSIVVIYERKMFIILATDCTSVHLRLLGLSRFKPCLGPGYFLLQSKGFMLETCMLLAGVKGPLALVIPVEANRVVLGDYKSKKYNDLN